MDRNDSGNNTNNGPQCFDSDDQRNDQKQKICTKAIVTIPLILFFCIDSITLPTRTNCAE
jgi:hypothetical protein